MMDNEIIKAFLDLINRQNTAVKKIKTDLKYYLDNNEENGVVYIPKFIIDNMLKELEVNENDTT